MSERGLIETLTGSQKWEIYFDYYITQLSLKHSFEVHDIYQTSNNNPLIPIGSKFPGFGKPDKAVHNLGLYYLWKDTNIYTFEEFQKGDHLYEWYWRFKDRINLNQNKDE
jgi:hypothetical protein